MARWSRRYATTAANASFDSRGGPGAGDARAVLGGLDDAVVGEHEGVLAVEGLREPTDAGRPPRPASSRA
ncbi:hypothetical protein [Streptomyces sp. NPDC059247]|uniref:hypothetical protein n=1 Tax=Streptomyces sp. NPDC059247 TaxID=3346790 RepID=UPI0036869F0E